MGQGKDPERIVIVSGSDDHYAFPLAVTLHSALQNLSEAYAADVYILDGGIRQENRRRLERVVRRHGERIRLQWVEPGTTSLQGLKSAAWYTVATYLRLLIPEALDTSITRAFYLDSDLVVEHDLSVLWEEPLEGNLVLAVRDYWNPRVRDAHSETYEVLELDPDAPYFNAGVMLIDLAGWRDERVSARAFDFVREHAQLIRFADQDGLNAVIDGRWKALDPRWNVMLDGLNKYLQFVAATASEREQQREALLKAPYIWHFAGATKPWNPGYGGHAQDRFIHYLRQSDWFASTTGYWAWHKGLMLGNAVHSVRWHWRRLRNASHG